MSVFRAFAIALMALVVAREAHASREFVDDAGRKVTLPDRIERVYAAGPPASVLVFALAPDKLIGWTRHFRDDEAQWVPEKYAKLPELGRLTGRDNTANVEVVLKEKPDVIIDVGATNATFASLADRVQSQTGIPYVLLDGRLQTTPLQVEKIASILGTPESGRELSAYASRILGGLREKNLRHSRRQAPRGVLRARAPGSRHRARRLDQVEMIELLGAKNVAGGEAGGLANVGLEQVVLWDPAIIVTNDPNFYREVWKLPVWNGVAAVRGKRVYLSPHLPFGWFDYPPGANRLIGLLWLSDILYPEVFRHDLAREVTEFYRLFYHQAPTADQVTGLLSEPGVAPR